MNDSKMPQEPDPVVLGLQIANAIWMAVHGPKAPQPSKDGAR